MDFLDGIHPKFVMIQNMTIINYVNNGLAFLTVASLCGCSVQSKQLLPVASEEKPPPGKCLIIVEREGGGFDALVKHEIYDNQTLVGTLTSQGGKFVWVRDPGPMVLRAKVAWPNQPTYGRVLNTEAGKRYYYSIRDKALDGKLKLLEGPGAQHIIAYQSKAFEGNNIHNGTHYQFETMLPICQNCGYCGTSFKPGCPIGYDSESTNALRHADNWIRQ
jgi:hypothetical protein